MTLRHDFLNMKVTNSVVGLSNSEFDGSGNNINVSAGYNIDLGNNWFVEPSAGFSYTRTEFDALGIMPFTGVTGDSISFNPTESKLGRIGVRAGTSFQATESLILSPFATISAWREFANNATGQAFITGTVVPVETTRVGTFYQTSAGVSGQLLNTGLLGFVRGDLRMGDRLDGWSLLGGGRYTF
jgi:outer membrane autotransporter protein